MMLRRLGVIGAGGIADVALSTLAERLALPLDQVTILVPADVTPQAEKLLDRLGDTLATSRKVVTDIAALLSDRPEAVAECASHVAVREYGAKILASGCDLVLISIGSLSDEDLRRELEQAAKRGGSRLVLPAGAIGGVDALVAAKLSGLESVTYIGRKPPEAWVGTAAEKIVDLHGLTKPTAFFEGNAREAAGNYPFNANVAATLGLAGIGFEQTKVRLVADPDVSRNVHEFVVRSACGDFSVRLEGRPSAVNPKTSLMAGFSVARELLNRAGTVVI
jgi:aspartate dehydrogenase